MLNIVMGSAFYKHQLPAKQLTFFIIDFDSNNRLLTNKLRFTVFDFCTLAAFFFKQNL